MDAKKYFKVTCKCGHAGSRNMCLMVEFPVCAESKKEAAVIGRRMPRCKHDHPDAIREVVEISKDRYDELIEINNNDPYLHCKCIQDQDYSMIEDRVQVDEYLLNFRKEQQPRREASRRRIYAGKEVIRNPRVYYRNNPIIVAEDE